MKLWTEHFSPGEYLRIHADVAQSGVDPEIHFLVFGNEEFRDPSDQFDTKFYLRQYPEVGKTGINALVHYTLFGHQENRIPHPQLQDSGPAVPDVETVQVSNRWPAGCPLVSVVIPCFNYGQFLEGAIRSVLDQTFEDVEIIVVDGGSTDPESLAEVRRLESLGFPKTRFYYRSSRCLVGDNRNYGIQKASGRYICCLDADDLLSPVYLEIAVFLAESYGYDFVYPSVQTFGAAEFLWLVKDASFSEILEENRVSTVALFRRCAWANVGGYRDWPPGPDHLPEDWDFWIRMVGHGFRGRAIREPLLRYRVHDGSLSRTTSLEIGEQRTRLHAVNSDLIQTFSDNQHRAVSVLNPYENLGSLDDERPAVLLALPFLTIGGAEHLFRTIGKAIVDRGQRLIVTTSLTLSSAIPEYKACFDGITRHVYPLPRLFHDVHTQARFLSYLIRRYNVRTLMLAGSELVYHMLPDLARQFPDMTIVDQLFNDAVHVANNRRYESQIHATVVPSEQLLQTLVERDGADPSTIHVIPHGIRIPEDGPGDRSILPAEAADKVVVGFFGRLSPEKAPDLFIEMARELAAEENLFFVMTGEGPERTQTLEQIRKHRLAERIYAPGFVQDVEPLIRACDIVVLPSRIDGMPLVVLEAQAMGKPVVASRVGSLPAMIADEETGFLCEIGDVAAFCERILALACNPGLRAGMGAAGRQRACDRYSAGRMLEQYFQVFRSPRASVAVAVQ